MAIIKWFLWRRWLTKRWLKNGAGNFLSNAWKCNAAGCKRHPIIYRDMVRIVKSKEVTK